MDSCSAFVAADVQLDAVQKLSVQLKCASSYGFLGNAGFFRGRYRLYTCGGERFSTKRESSGICVFLVDCVDSVLLYYTILLLLLLNIKYKECPVETKVSSYRFALYIGI